MMDIKDAQTLQKQFTERLQNDIVAFYKATGLEIQEICILVPAKKPDEIPMVFVKVLL